MRRRKRGSHAGGRYAIWDQRVHPDENKREGRVKVNARILRMPRFLKVISAVAVVATSPTGNPHHLFVQRS
jgi:hypothetical protein